MAAGQHGNLPITLKRLRMTSLSEALASKQRIAGVFSASAVRLDGSIKFDIPVTVQIVGRKPVYGHLLSIAAGVVIVGSVKRLMYVADQVQEEL